MSKLAHSNQTTMDEIEWRRLIEDGDYEEALGMPLTSRVPNVYAGTVKIASTNTYLRKDIPVDMEDLYAALFASAPTLKADNEALREKLEKLAAWLERLASNSDRLTKDSRFKTIQEAGRADAKTYRATVKDIHDVLKQHGSATP